MAGNAKNRFLEAEKMFFSCLGSLKETQNQLKKLEEINSFTETLLKETENKEFKNDFLKEAGDKNLLDAANSLKAELLALQEKNRLCLNSLNKLCLMLEIVRNRRKYFFRNRETTIKFTERLLQYWNEPFLAIKPSLREAGEEFLPKNYYSEFSEDHYSVNAKNAGKAISRLLSLNKSFSVELAGSRLSWLSENTVLVSAQPNRLKEMDAIALSLNASLN